MPDVKFKWKLTDDYKITELPSPTPSYTMNEDAEKTEAGEYKSTGFKAGEKLRKMLLKSSFSPEDEPIKTPNCSLCRWKEEEMRFYQVSPFKHFETKHYMCNTQGLKDCDECYNTQECKALYQPDNDHAESFEEWKKSDPENTFIPARFEESVLYIISDFREDQTKAQLMAWTAAMETK
jgi:hypothetical protein